MRAWQHFWLDGWGEAAAGEGSVVALAAEIAATGGVAVSGVATLAALPAAIAATGSVSGVSAPVTPSGGRIRRRDRIRVPRYPDPEREPQPEPLRLVGRCELAAPAARIAATGGVRVIGPASAACAPVALAVVGRVALAGAATVAGEAPRLAGAARAGDDPAALWLLGLLGDDDYLLEAA
jgi:hypothetical protein